MGSTITRKARRVRRGELHPVALLTGAKDADDQYVTGGAIVAGVGRYSVNHGMSFDDHLAHARSGTNGITAGVVYQGLYCLDDLVGAPPPWVA